eukprot:m.420712 g.420712  ORF g.420712 m.420712 type:complete len:330 (+) comp32764_c0_seq1:217-1206(+)
MAAASTPPPAYGTTSPSSPSSPSRPTQPIEYGTASPMSPTSPTSRGDHVYVYEHQRWYPLSKWCSSRLPTDPKAFTDAQGVEVKCPPGPASPAPLGTVFVADEKWEVGDWMYAVDHGYTLFPLMRKTDCVRRRIWRRRIVLDGPAVLPGDGAAAASAATAATMMEGSLQATWEGGASRHAVFDAGQLFLLEAPGASKATLTIPAAKIATVTELHHLEVGSPHAFALGLDAGPTTTTSAPLGPPGGVTRVQIIAVDDETMAHWITVLRQAAKAARPVFVPAMKRGAKVAGDTLGQGARLVGGYFSGAFGAGMGWRLGGRVGERVADTMDV